MTTTGKTPPTAKTSTRQATKQSTEQPVASSQDSQAASVASADNAGQAQSQTQEAIVRFPSRRVWPD